MEAALLRLTKSVRDALLKLNEGFETTTHFKGKNFTESRVYKIIDGVLHVHSTGKTSWGGSRFSNDFVADNEQTHRFLKDNLRALKKDGLE